MVGNLIHFIIHKLCMQKIVLLTMGFLVLQSLQYTYHGYRHLLLDYVSISLSMQICQF
jgi:hypothetical protein